MIIERVERRCLGAIEFIDALTGARVREPLQLAAPGLRLVANGSALQVIRAADGLDAHVQAFERPPGAPALRSRRFDLTVTDPQRRYLPRRVEIRLPRKDAPLADADSVLRPIRVLLYPGGARAVDPLWAVLRASVYQLVDGARIGLANAWLTLTPTLPGVAPVSALTDGNGEALLAVAGVAPVLVVAGEESGTDEDGDGVVEAPVFSREFNAALRVVLDSAVLARADARGPRPVADPDQIEQRVALGPPAVRVVNPPVGPLSAGAMRRVQVEVTP